MSCPRIRISPTAAAAAEAAAAVHYIFILLLLFDVIFFSGFSISARRGRKIKKYSPPIKYNIYIITTPRIQCTCDACFFNQSNDIIIIIYI